MRDKLRESAVELERELGIGHMEVEAYFELIHHNSLTIKELGDSLGKKLTEIESTMKILVERGMVIVDSRGSDTYRALHPRMAITNVFKMLREDNPVKRREKRFAADRISKTLESIYESKRGMNGIEFKQDS